MQDDLNRDYRFGPGAPHLPGEPRGFVHYHLEVDPEEADRDLFRTCERLGCHIEPYYVRSGIIVDGDGSAEFWSEKQRVERPRLETPDQRRQLDLSWTEAEWVPAAAWAPATSTTVDHMIAAIRRGPDVREKRRRRPDDVKEYHFPDDERLKKVTLRTALINGNRHGRVAGISSERCRYRADADGFIAARHEIDVTSDYVDLTRGSISVHPIGAIDSSEYGELFQGVFASDLVDRAVRPWKDDDCDRRAAYVENMAAKEEKDRVGRLEERSTRLGEVEADLRKELAHSEYLRQIIIVLTFVVIGYLFFHWGN